MPSIRSLEQRRICFVAPYMGGNGKALYWGKLFEGLVARGLSVEVLTGPRFEREECPNIVQNDTVTFTRLFGMVVPSPYVLVSLLKLKCDVMLILEFNILALMATVLSCLKGRTKSILLIENAPQFTSAKRGGLFRLVRKVQCRLCTGILTNNAAAFDYLVNQLGVPPSKIMTSVYLTSSLASGPLPVRAASAVGRKVRFVCIGRLISGKGFMELIDEVALLDETERGLLEIDVFGEGPCRAELQKRIDDQGLSGVFRLKGNIPYAELGSRIAAADVFIMPSLGDYRSLASFEALSLGLPLLISVHDGAHGEVLGGQGNGVLIDPLTRGSMSQAIREILKHPGQLQAMGEKSLSHAQSFTVEKAVSNLALAVERAVVGRMAP